MRIIWFNRRRNENEKVKPAEKINIKGWCTLKSYRAEKQITQKIMAEKLHIGTRQMAEFESTKSIENPIVNAIDRLVALSKELEIEPLEFIPYLYDEGRVGSPLTIAFSSKISMLKPSEAAELKKYYECSSNQQVRKDIKYHILKKCRKKNKNYV